MKELSESSKRRRDSLVNTLQDRFPVGQPVLYYRQNDWQIRSVVAIIESRFKGTGQLWMGIATSIDQDSEELSGFSIQDKEDFNDRVWSGNLPERYRRHYYRGTEFAKLILPDNIEYKKLTGSDTAVIAGGSYTLWTYIPGRASTRMQPPEPPILIGTYKNGDLVSEAFTERFIELTNFPHNEGS